MEIKHSTKKTEKELFHLIHTGKEIKDINKLGIHNYKELNTSLKHWRKSIKDSFNHIFKDNKKMIEEIFPSSGAFEMIGGRSWEYKFDYYMEEVDEIIHSLESVRKRLYYAKKKHSIGKYFKNSKIIREIFFNIFWFFSIMLLIIIIIIFLRCSIITKEIEACTINTLTILKLIQNY